MTPLKGITLTLHGHCDHHRKSVASRVYMYAYLMRYCLICIFYFIFKIKCNTKSISLNMKIKLVESAHKSYPGHGHSLCPESIDTIRALWLEDLEEEIYTFQTLTYSVQSCALSLLSRICLFCQRYWKKQYPHNCVPFLKEMISARIFNQDLDHIIVPR